MYYSEYNGAILVPCPLADKADVDTLRSDVDARELRYLTTVANQASTTSMTDIAEMTSIDLAVGVYSWEVLGRFRSTTTGCGAGFRIKAKIAVLEVCAGMRRVQNSASGTSAFYEYNQTDQTTNIASTSTPTANADYYFDGKGVPKVTTPGSVIVQQRAEVSNNTITVQPYVYLRLRKMS